MVYPWELPSIMRKLILTGAMGTVYFALMSGMFLVAFGNGVGLKARHWGIRPSAPSSAAPSLPVPAAYTDASWPRT
ncbi:MAG: hypothetical protein ACYS1C_12915, partial [Planctomycetota bacterium]